MITRIHLDTDERRILPMWVAFKTQSNPDWEEQDASVWPVQKFAWRDLTLRRSRDSLAMRQGELRVKYEIVPVGLPAPGRAAVPQSPTAHPNKYKGKPIPLYICGDAIETNEVVATTDFGDISAAFNNGILSTQFLRKQLKTAKGQTPSKKAVEKRIGRTNDSLRNYLAGDILPFLRRLFERAHAEDGQVHLALYELSDHELVDLLLQNKARLHLILCTAGNNAKTKTWDTTNTDARKKLRTALGTRLQDRMFNNSAHIGHNKFAVLVVGGKATAVWTGSTNWTATGLCGQTNNCIIVDSPELARAYFTYWTRLHADKLPVPKPISSPNKTDQGLALRKANMKSNQVSLDQGATDTEIWFSPNTEKTGSPATRTVPPDLAVVFEHMKQAKHAIFFLVFNPGRTKADGDDINTVVSAGLNFARLDPKLLVLGAISDPTALPGYQAPPRKDKDAKPDKKAPKIPLPAIFTPEGAPNVLMIRAAAVRDLIGDFQRELLTLGHAIIHDKIVVIDPLSKKDCVVIAGSHNLGFKASYANDENFAIIRGNQDLALAYAVHVMDVYDHYKFRAVLEQQTRDAMLKKKKKVDRPTGQGFLDTTDVWQDPYFAGEKGDGVAYFLS